MMKIENRHLADIIPYSRNPRVNDQAIGRVAASIREYGPQQPIVVDGDGVVIVGHTRLLAAQQLGLDAFPVTVAGKLSAAQAKAYRIMDNRSGEAAEWDGELLRLELEDLEGMDFDIELTGFDGDDLDEVLAGGSGIDGLTDPDDVPEEQEREISKPGDLWVMGGHRLVCGDSTDESAVNVALAGQKADVCLTDPPYGLGEKKESGKNNYCEYQDTEENLDVLAKKWIHVSINNSKVVVFSPGVTNAWKYPPADWIMCWFYGGGQLRSSWGFNCWQPFLCYGKDPSLASGHGGRPDAINMNVPANAADINHPCPKPIALWTWMINRLSFSNEDIFFEPFSGSGTTIIAAEQTGRKCCAIEISPRYVDVAVRRWQEFTGQDAVLESTGQTFAEVEAG